MDLFSKITLPPNVSECLANPRCKLSIVVGVIALIALFIFGATPGAPGVDATTKTGAVSNVLDQCKYWWGAFALSKLFSSNDGSEIRVSKPADDIFSPDAILSDIKTDLAPF